MDTIFRGDLVTVRGRLLAWLDCLLVDHGIFRLAWSNFAPVVPDQLYRCNHPLPGRLATLTRRFGLRTLINLRGPTGNGADALSREAAARLGLVFIDVPMRSCVPPRREVIQHLHEIYRTMQEPALIHCKSGADRAGLAASIYLLFIGAPVAEARAQLSLRFGHFSWSRAGVLDAFLSRYQIEAEGRKSFLQWLQDDYDPLLLSYEAPSNRVIEFINDRLLHRE